MNIKTIPRVTPPHRGQVGPADPTYRLAVVGQATCLQMLHLSAILELLAAGHKDLLVPSTRPIILITHR